MGFSLKRLGFRRSDAAQANNSNLTSSDTPSNSGESIEKDKTITSGHQVTEETALEAQKKLDELQRKHRWDPNLPSDILEDLDKAAHAHDVQQDVNLVGAFEDNSPYPEVRAAVRNVSVAIPHSASHGLINTESLVR